MEKVIEVHWYINVPLIGKTKCIANFSTVKEAVADMKLNGIKNYIIKA